MPLLFALVILFACGGLGRWIPSDLPTLLSQLGQLLILVWAVLIYASVRPADPEAARSDRERRERGQSYADGAP